jgi:hypothetical protein
MKIVIALLFFTTTAWADVYAPPTEDLKQAKAVYELNTAICFPARPGCDTWRRYKADIKNRIKAVYTPTADNYCDLQSQVTDGEHLESWIAADPQRRGDIIGRIFKVSGNLEDLHVLIFNKRVKLQQLPPSSCRVPMTPAGYLFHQDLPSK